VFTGLFSLVFDFDLDCTLGGRMLICGAFKASLTCFPTLAADSDPISPFFYGIVRTTILAYISKDDIGYVFAADLLI
jgi:hypothetical protein